MLWGKSIEYKDKRTGQLIMWLVRENYGNGNHFQSGLFIKVIFQAIITKEFTFLPSEVFKHY